MTPVKASSFGHRIGFCRRYPGGWRERSILRTVPRASPTRRAAARSLHPSTYTRRRTAAESSTRYIPPVFHKTPSECSVDHASGLVFRRPQAASHRRAVVYCCSAVLNEMFLRLNEVVYAPFYALFLVGSIALLVELSRPGPPRRSICRSTRRLAENLLGSVLRRRRGGDRLARSCLRIRDQGQDRERAGADRALAAHPEWRSHHGRPGGAK